MSLPALVPFATLELLPDPPGRADGQTYMGGPLTAVRGVVFHVNAGNSDPRNWWTQPGNPSVASAHLQIMKDGRLLQYVPLNRVAWAEVDGNGSWHSVETEGFPPELLTAAQFETFAKLLAWGHTNCGWQLQVCDSPTGYGLGTHSMGGADWGGHACPGPLRASQRPALIARALQILGGAPQAVPAPPHPAPTPPRYGWNLPPGHYYGNIAGPNNCHGGITPNERLFVRNIQQWLIHHGCVAGLPSSAWATSTWADGRWQSPTDTAMALWHSRFYKQPQPNQCWSDDYDRLARP